MSGKLFFGVVAVGAFMMMKKKNVDSSWVWPVPGHTRLSSPYGARKDPFTGATTECHRGLDIPAPKGTPVVAAVGGVAYRVGVSKNGAGNIVYVSTGDMETRYMHLSEQAVVSGDVVTPGQVIGYVGSTGRSTGPHLHFGLLVGGSHVDPSEFFGLTPGTEC